MSNEHDHSTIPVDWSRLVADREWQLYRPVLEQAVQDNLPFAIGGGIAFSLYSRRWRNTRDIDLFVRPDDRESFITLLTQHGFEDYFSRESYDRSWIYRGYQDGAIIDIIWQMANHRAVVDDAWIKGGATFVADGVSLRLISPEALIFAKLYVMQRERCDWPDLLSVLHSQADVLDWDHLVRWVGDDLPLLTGLLCVYRWLCPENARRIPEHIWAQFHLADLPHQEQPGLTVNKRRIDLLDSRDWFGPNDDSGTQQEPSC